MKKTNWSGIQSPKNRDTKQHEAVADCNVSKMTMGSWHADKSKDGVRRKRRKGRQFKDVRSNVTGKKRPKIKVWYPPAGGWQAIPYGKVQEFTTRQGIKGQR